MTLPDRPLKPYQVGVIHTRIGSMLNEIYQERDLITPITGGEDRTFWRHTTDIIVKHFKEMMTHPSPAGSEDNYLWVRERADLDKGLVFWREVDTESNRYTPPDYFDSRSQEIIVGLTDLDAPSSQHHRLVAENRLIIAYPGNMFGLPIDSWVLQEQQGPDIIQGEGYEYFLEEHSDKWPALITTIHETWKSIQDERLELSMDEKIPSSEVGYPVPHKPISMDDYWSRENVAEDFLWTKWKWFIVPQPYLPLDGVVIQDSPPYTLCEFIVGNLIISIGRVAPRWLSTRTINWYLPYPLVPWTDPLK